MALVPFNKRSGELRGFDDFSSLFDDFFNVNWPSSRAWKRDVFKVDVQDKGDSYLVEADLPGVKKENIMINLDEGNLTISVKEEESNEEINKARNYIHRERSVSSMMRSMYLGDVSDEDVKAKLENGVLYLTLKKKTKAVTSKNIVIE